MIKIFCDGADLNQMSAFKDKVDGFTTNPSLMRNAGVTNYGEFAKVICDLIKGKPISFEVVADEMVEMERQARVISSWGENVYVKIPCTLTNGKSTGLLVSKLGKKGIKINVTAVLTFQQISEMTRFIWVGTPAILSIFAGRIADTGRDPVPFFTKALQQKHGKTQILWASTREIYNVKQAERAGADIITVTPDIIKKLDLFGKDLAQYSLETVKMFYKDGQGWTV